MAATVELSVMGGIPGLASCLMGAGAGGVKRIYDHQGLRKQLVVLLKKSWSGSEVFWEVLMLLKIVTLVLFHRRED